jgi:hypothetical protein
LSGASARQFAFARPFQLKTQSLHRWRLRLKCHTASLSKAGFIEPRWRSSGCAAAGLLASPSTLPEDFWHADFYQYNVTMRQPVDCWRYEGPASFGSPCGPPRLRRWRYFFRRSLIQLATIQLATPPASACIAVQLCLR